MPQSYQIKAQANGDAELLIYGDIGDNWLGEGVEAKEVAERLAAMDVQTIDVRINSYGGSVADGLAIYNTLRRHQATVNVHIDGVAISIASLIAMAGDKVIMAENALFMVHAPWSGAIGNAKEFREYADMLDKYSEAMANSYARKTGQEHDTILAILTDGEDHWYTAAEALAFGFIDEVAEEEMAVAASGFKQSRFWTHAPAAANKIAEQNKPATEQHSTQSTSNPAAPVAAHHQPEEEALMPNSNNNPATTTQAATTTEPNAAQVTEAQNKAIEAAQAKERQRKTDIRSAFEFHTNREGVYDLLVDCLDNDSISVEQAQAKLLEHLGKDAEPLAHNHRVEMGESEQEKFAKGAQASILARAGLAQPDDANEFRGYSLIEVARRALAMNNVNTDRMDKMTMVSAAFTHTSGDFTNILSNIANKAMLKGYEEAEETFQAWTNKGELPDFKQARRVDLNAFPSLDKVRDGAEYKTADIGDRGEVIQLATFGKLFNITRQTVINDDLMAFTRIPRKMGSAAIRTVGDLVYAVLTSNPNMADGTALFHADHKNLRTAAAPSTSSVDAMRSAMAKQKDAGKKATLNIRLGNVLAPVALEGAAKVVRDSEFEVGASSKNNTVPNSVRGTFEVISDARLDDSSETEWYGAANPGMHDTVEVAYLDGNDRPVLEQQQGWSVDGTEFKVRIDAGVSPLDFRTLQKNPYAG